MPIVRETHANHHSSPSHTQACEEVAWTDLACEDSRRRLEDDVCGEKNQRYSRLSINRISSQTSDIRIQSPAFITHVSHPDSQFQLSVHTSDGRVGKVRAIHQRNAVHDSDDRHQPPVKTVDDLLLLSWREVGQRVVFDRLPLVVALLAMFHVRDLLFFVVVLCGDSGLQASHVGRLVCSLTGLGEWD